MLNRTTSTSSLYVVYAASRSPDGDGTGEISSLCSIDQRVDRGFPLLRTTFPLVTDGVARISHAVSLVGDTVPLVHPATVSFALTGRPRLVTGVRTNVPDIG